MNRHKTHNAPPPKRQRGAIHLLLFPYILPTLSVLQRHHRLDDLILTLLVQVVSLRDIVELHEVRRHLARVPPAAFL